MDVLDFNNLINQLVYNIPKQQRFLLGDFTINSLNYSEHQTTDKFLESRLNLFKLKAY